MAIKNLFGRGIGFGGPEWIPTHGYSIGAESLTTYAIIGPFTDKRPPMPFTDRRPTMAFSMPEVNDG